MPESKEFTSKELSKRLRSIDIDMRPAHLYPDDMKVIHGYTAQQGWQWVHDHRDEILPNVVAIYADGVEVQDKRSGVNGVYLPYVGSLADIIWEVILYVERIRISER